MYHNSIDFGVVICSDDLVKATIIVAFLSNTQLPLMPLSSTKLYFSFFKVLFDGEKKRKEKSILIVKNFVLRPPNSSRIVNVVKQRYLSKKEKQERNFITLREHRFL